MLYEVITIEVYSFTDRLFFGTYVLMTYLIRFFIPYPLSTLHPFPPSGNLGWPVWISPLVIAVLLVLLWYRRKDKVLVFGVLFFLINLLLVLQVRITSYNVCS